MTVITQSAKHTKLFNQQDLCIECDWNERSVFIPSRQTVTINISADSSTRGNRESLTCYKCGGLHHFKSECSTWRTRLCTKWKSGSCNDPFCAFAHGESELRQPWLPMCVRVIRSDDGLIQTQGCRAFGHSIHRCPFGGFRFLEQSKRP